MAMRPVRTPTGIAQTGAIVVACVGLVFLGVGLGLWSGRRGAEFGAELKNGAASGDVECTLVMLVFVVLLFD